MTMTSVAEGDISTPSDGWMELRIWAELFEDAQQTRIAATNRASRGSVDGIYDAYLERVELAEKECGKAMRKCMKRVASKEILDWLDRSAGIGDHLLARLLGHLGHPVHAFPHHWEGSGAKRVLVSDEPFARSVGQLWQFCGHGAPSVRRRGMSAEEAAANGSPKLKMIVHLLAESGMKQVARFDQDRNMTRPTGVYRLVYEECRLDFDGRLHSVECVRCGPSGKPAQIGSPWSAAHQHAAALRLVGKEILRDLWLVSQGLPVPS